MKRLYLSGILMGLFLVFAAGSQAQTDELRQATGLPIAIGSPAVFGQVTIKRLDKDAPRPRIQVTLLEGGSQLERVQTNDEGYYYFRTAPRGNATLVFELTNSEIGRIVINPGASRNIRQDITIDWQEIKQMRASVVDARMNDAYKRNAEADRVFAEAIRLGKEKEYAKAIPMLVEVVKKDAKDFVIWTELGTLYFKANSLDNAEACYFKAIELKKDYFPALLNLGKLYLGQKQHDNAILVLSNAAKAKPDSADAHQFLGEAYLQAKKGSLAVPELNEAIRLAPAEKADIHLRLASLYDAAGMKAKASAEYKQFLQKRPDHAEKAQLEKYIQANPPQ